ncbi:hypothetical protein AWRI796_5168 [Saccharomyces cerevisiae AWRI796]|nr:hypothetical protein AWRI796_5168 [Saccharomyces cerevisiae AWRI796]
MCSILKCSLFMSAFDNSQAKAFASRYRISHLLYVLNFSIVSFFVEHTTTVENYNKSLLFPGHILGHTMEKDRKRKSSLKNCLFFFYMPLLLLLLFESEKRRNKSINSHTIRLWGRG